MTAPDDAVLGILGALPLFRGCSASDLRRLTSLLEPVHVRAGTALLGDGGVATTFFVVAGGTASVRRADHVVGLLAAGDVFGELAARDGGGRIASIVAETDLDLLVWGSRAVEELIRELPTLTQQMLDALRRRQAALGLAPSTP